MLRDTPGTGDGDRYYQPIYDDLFSDTGRRDIFNIFYTDRPAPLGQSNRSRSAGARTHIGRFEDRGAYALMQGVHLEDMYPRSGARTIDAWTRTIVYAATAARSSSTTAPRSRRPVSGSGWHSTSAAA